LVRQEEEGNGEGNVLKGKTVRANKWREKVEEKNGVVCVIGGGATVSAFGTNERGGLKVT